MYDVVIIGAGVVGSSVARYLSQFQVKACVLEKGNDVCTGTSKANSAIVHAGYDAKNGTLMARYNVEGSEMMEELSKELDFAYDRIGSLVVCMAEEDRPNLVKLYENGIKNGVKGLEIIERDRLAEMEPNIADEAVCALWAPTGAVVCPFGLTIAMAENAYTNGVEFIFNTQVDTIEKTAEGYRVIAGDQSYETKCVVNAAGLYSGKFHNLFAEKKLNIIPRKGEYMLLDHTARDHVKHTVFQLPGKLGKGVLVSPTVHGNLLLGPTALDVENPEATNTTAAGLDEVATKCALAVKDVPTRQVITSFAGLRAHEEGHEFVLGEIPEAPGFFDCAGVESPGLSSAPAIGKMIAEAVADKLKAPKNPAFNGKRSGIIDAKKLSLEERNELIKKQPAYGQIICRCESISEGEILDAIRRPLGAKDLDGVKRRVRAGMGRCQAGFCSPRVMEILARELKVDQAVITKNGGRSGFIVGVAKDRI